MKIFPLLMVGLMLNWIFPSLGQGDVPRHSFQREDGALQYVGEDWSIRSAPNRGWVSLRGRDAEFLAAGETFGGMAIVRGETILARFPDSSNLSHDQLVGRQGSVSDGVHMIRVTPAPVGSGFELYVGFNDDAPADLVIYLSDEVQFVRSGFAPTVRAWTNVVTRNTSNLVEVDGAACVHQAGPILLVQGKVKVGVVKDPAGKPRLALVLPCKGFAANAFNLVIDAAGRVEYWATRPAFDVRSSDDPAAKALGPTHGVKNPIYTKNTQLDFGITFGWLGYKPFSGYAEVEVIHALGQPHFRQKVELKDVAPDKTGQIRVKFEPKFSLPGVSEVWGRLVGADGRLIWTDRYRMGYELEAYRPRLMVEPDFQAFWTQTLEELRRQPLNPTTRRVEAFADHPDFEIYEVTYTGWAGKTIYAMLFVPRDGPRPLPAIITAHPGTRGYGVNKKPDGTYGSQLRQDKRFVTLVPLIRGHKPDAPDVPFNHPWWGPLEDRDTYVARSWYCAMVRGMDYLASRPDLVDMKRVVSRGGSQGGALALVTAGLDNRVAVCLADCPANCQPHEIMENYPSFGPSRGQVPPGKTLAEVERMLSYYNPVNFAPMIKCPTYVGSNIGDLTVHAMGPLAAYHNLTGLEAKDKAFYPGFTHFHGSGPGLGVKTREWLERLGGPAEDGKNKSAN